MINQIQLKQFVTHLIGGSKLEQKDAKNFDITEKKYTDINTDNNDYLDIDEIFADDDLYDKFVALYNEDNDAKNAEAEQEENKKDEKLA